jgi:FtsH-binding integral membrane protein
MVPLELIKGLVGKDEDPIDKPVNQLALLSLVLSIFAFTLLASTPATNNYDYLTALVSVVAIALGHTALAGNQTKRDNRLAVRGLIAAWGLFGVSVAWAIVKWM